MRKRGAPYGLFALALILWGALIVFVNENPPTLLNQGFFLAIWLGAMISGSIPISYMANSRWATSLGRAGDLARSMRQGILAGVLTTILMALPFMHLLTLLYGVVLVLLVVMVEMLISL